MRRLIRILLSILAFAWIVDAGAQPADTSSFSVTYGLDSGSVPPPWYWQYTVTIRSEGSSDIVMVPGRPAWQHDLPRWQANFSPTKSQLASLLGFLEANEFFNEDAWLSSQQKDGPVPVGPPGDPICKIAVSRTVNASRVVSVIPCDDYLLKEADRAKRDALVKIVMDLVPNEDLEKLKSLQSEYASKSANYDRFISASAYGLQERPTFK